MAMNSVDIIGRLTRDIVLKYTAGGMAIATGSIAVDRNVKKNGEWIQEVNFFEFSAFGKLGESLKPYLVKGKEIAIDGYLKQERWQDQQTGQQRSKVTIVANDITLLGGRNNQQQNQEPTQEAGCAYSEPQGFQEDYPYGN